MLAIQGLCLVLNIRYEDLCFYTKILVQFFCRSSLFVMEPFSIRRMTLCRNCFIIVHIASDLTDPPVRRLHISLAFGSFMFCRLLSLCRMAWSHVNAAHWRVGHFSDSAGPLTYWNFERNVHSGNLT
jgi:hypothetical protein